MNTQLLTLCLLGLTQVSSRVQTFDGGPSFEITYDKGRDALKIDATVPNAQFLAIAFGRGMINVDMAVMQAAGKDGHMTDRWATFYVPPAEDDNREYQDAETKKEGDLYHFVGYRKLDTGDAE